MGAQTTDGYTPLMYAAITKADCRSTFFKLLRLASESVLNKQTRDGRSVAYLTLAATPRLDEYLLAILDRGPDLNLVDSDGGTILTHAVIHNHTRWVRELIARGANPMHKNAQRESLLAVASRLVPHIDDDIIMMLASYEEEEPYIRTRMRWIKQPSEVHRSRIAQAAVARSKHYSQVRAKFHVKSRYRNGAALPFDVPSAW